MGELLPCQIEMLLNREYNKKEHTVTYVCSNSYTVKVEVEESDDLDDFCNMDRKVISSFTPHCLHCK